MAGPDTTPWRRVGSRRSSSDIVSQVMDRFFAEMKPGEWLGTESEFAERFGVSRVTIRDAIRELEARGIVEVKVGARGGLRVAAEAPQRLSDALAVQIHLLGVTWDQMLEAQQALEPTSARLAAERATPEEIEELHALLEDSRHATAEPEVFAALAVRFHLQIAEAAHSPVIATSLSALQRVQAAEHGPRTSLARARRVVAAHHGLYEAIAAGDAELAVARMQEHLVVVRRRGAGYACGLEAAA